MNHFKGLFFLLLSLSFTACKELEIDRSILISQDFWYFESLSGYDVAENQIRNQILTGSRYNFRADGNYFSIVASIIDQGKWEFNIDKTVLTMDSGEPSEVVWTIITLSEEELTVSIEHEKAINGTYIMTFN